MGADPNPFQRRNELWVEVVPPERDDWLRHAGHIATEAPAKNTSFYQLKDIPWATPTPWGAAASAPGSAAAGPASWQAATSFKGNSLRAAFPPAPGDAPLALDRNALGQLAIARAAPPDGGAGGAGGDGAGEPRGEYAVARVGGWPLTGAAVADAHGALLRALGAAGLREAAAGCFRVLVRAPGEAELWVRVLRP